MHYCLLTAVLFPYFMALGCTQGHCRRKVEAPSAVPILESPSEVAAATSKPEEKDRIYVYKYDGSLQCQKAKSIAVDVMAKELKGIPILSSIKKSDGMMHIQVCGTITGMANVYEIPTRFLKQAEARGFKKWNFE
jgi:hypothetical protein